MKKLRLIGVTVVFVLALACLHWDGFRTHAATFTVTNLNDGGPGSLRQAILDANAAAGDDTINFAPAVTGVIFADSNLPTIVSNITINGPGANLLTIQSRGGGNDRTVFIIDRDAALHTPTVTISGLTITGGSNSVYVGGGITAYAHLTINNCTISGNHALSGGGIANLGAEITINNSTISGNTAQGAGGGIFQNSQTIIVRTSTISGNHSDTNGGGIYIAANQSGSILINSTITANTSSVTGGGISSTTSFSISDKLSLQNSIIAGNGSGAKPDIGGNFNSLGHNLIGNTSGNTDFGGTDLLNQSPLLGSLQFNGGPTQTHALLTGSPAINAGDNNNAPATDQRGYGRVGTVDIGAYEAPYLVTNTNDSGAGSLRQAIVSVNDAPPQAIAFAISTPGPWIIQLQSALPDITSSLDIIGPGANLLTVRGEGENDPYRIFNISGNVTVKLSGLTISNGNAFGGGAIRNQGILTLDNCAISDNVSTNYGGGIETFSGSLTVNNCTISGNKSLNGGGGGIYYGFGALTITNSTISGNQAAFGGGIYANTGTGMSAINVTIVGNTAPFGGGIYVISNTAAVRNVIIAGNTGNDGADIKGPFNSQGHNLIGKSNGGSGFTSGSNGDIVGTNTTPVDARLGPLVNNGGPTNTHALLSGSPARDAGDNTNATAVDQRGLTRICNTTIDIGAYEVQQFIVTNANDDGGGSLRQALTDALAAPGSEISFTLVGTNTINLASALPTISRDLSISGPGANLLTVRRNTSDYYRIFVINGGVTATISGLTIANGQDPNDCAGGGGIRNHGSLTLYQSAITGNFGCLFGGGIFNGGTLVINGSTLSGNSAPFFSGGAIYNTGDLTVTNSTISGNLNNTVLGGGIYNAGGIVTISNSTIANNNQGLKNASGTVQVRNTIFAGNSSGDFVGTLNSQGNNLIQNTAGATIVGTTAGNQLGVNALLGPLQDNGGPTFTHTLVCGSPAIDHGSNPDALATDQRGAGFPRTFGAATDIGAYELQQTCKADQTITFNALANKNLGDADFSVSATASSSLVVGFAASGSCTLNSNTVHLTGTGSCTITASQGGDANYNAAPDVPRTFTIAAALATHLLVSAPALATSGASFSITVTALNQSNQTATGYSGTVHFTSDDGQANLPANSSLINGVGVFNATLVLSGSHTITATDTVSNSINGTSNSISVTGAASYVEASGNCGAGHTPCFTGLGAAIGAANDNDIVNVMGGTLVESVNLNKNVKININGDTTINDLTISNGIINAGNATLTLSAGDWTNNGGTFNMGSGAVSFAGSGQSIGGSNPTTFNNLIIGSGGTTVNLAPPDNGTNAVAVAPVDVTVFGQLTLNGDLTVTNPAKVIMLPGATSAGNGDLIGSVMRTNGVAALPANVDLTFGNPNNIIRFDATGAIPTDVIINLDKNAPATFPGAVKRTYTVTQNNGNGFVATLQLHYQDGDLNGNIENSISLWRFNSALGQWQNVGANSRDTTNNWVQKTGVTDFSVWSFRYASSPTAAEAQVSGQIVDSSGSPVEGATVQLSGAQNRMTITDANGNYHFDNVETNGFYSVVPTRANFTFSPSTRSFSQLGSHTDAVFTGTHNGDVLNPLDTTEYFVRQQYLDVLGREPDAAGFNYWSNQILACGSDVICTNKRRREVAAAFFIEQEFQLTGSFIYNLYEGALGRRPVFAEYTADRPQVVGGANLESEKTAFSQDFVQRAEVMQKYQANTSAESFVHALIQNVQQSAGIDLSGRYESLLSAYNSGSSMIESRAAVLRTVADNGTFKQRQYNAAFVLTEYFVYLRRDPDQAGYDFWLNVLNHGDQGNYRGMVCSFITASEYQQRFSAVITHANGECSW